MARHFEDLPVWKSGRELVKRVYAFTRLPPARRDGGFCDQIQRLEETEQTEERNGGTTASS
jgi:hypothetical protein